MAQLLPVEIDKLIGKRIQQRRKELGYSAEKLSECMNLSQQQLSRYERGVSKINVAHLTEIAVFLKTPISWFFQDCMPSEYHVEVNNSLDARWDNLSNLQKQKFIAFLDSLV